MFCSQCGAKIADNIVFCPNCGNKIVFAQSQSQIQTEVQPQPQPQAAPQPAPQPQPIPQPAPQPQVAPQPQMQGQPQYQQPRPQMQGQPQYQQPRPQMQGQPQYQQPRPQMQGQPQMQQPRPPMPPQQKPPKKKKGKAVIIVLIVLLLLFFFLLIVGAVAAVIFSGVLKNPKKVFAEDVVQISKNINEEIPSMGMIPLEALLHLGIDDTTNSHTSTRTTEIMSDAASEYDLELVQSYSYNKDNGDTAYDLTVNVNGSPMGSSAIYFTDDEFLFVPMSPDSSMIRYQIDSDTKESLKNFGAVERYSLMVMEKERGSGINWNEEKSNFSKDILGEIPKKSFKKSSDTYIILGEEKKCKTVTVTASGEEAFDIIKGFGDLIYKGIESDEEKLSAFDNMLSSYDELSGDLELTMTTYRYKKTPVAVSMEVVSNGEVSNYDISYYKKGSEKQVIFESGDSYYEESVISKGIGQTHMTNIVDLGSAYITIDQDSTGIGNSKELKGTFEIVPDTDPDGESMATAAGNSITGTIEETSILGDGVKTTTIESEKGTVSIVTTMERGNLDTSKITPPTFISESGVDCSNLEDLKTVLNVYTNEKAPKVDNAIVHMAQLYFLMIKQGGMLNNSGVDYD